MPTPRYRPELQGLRALAISLVVIYHVWIGRVSGGVDTFLFISMFLMTLSFARIMDSNRPFKIVSRWIRTFKRLIPLAVVTIGLTLVGGWLLLPETQWNALWRHGWASLFYIENWALIREGADYFALEGVNPFTHFWSLSIQGQVFITWPVLLGLSVCLGRRSVAFSPRQIFTTFMVVIFVVSLVWSIYSTATNQTVAYFDTRARLWEFAAGSLLALGFGERYLNPRYGVTAGWIGVAGLIACGMIFDVQGGFPGFVALWPLACAALIMTAGDTKSRWGVDRFLGHKTAVEFGNISYALYLVHWPILQFWTYRQEGEHPGLIAGAVIILLSVVLAWVLTRGVDEPVRATGARLRTAWSSLAYLSVLVTTIALPLALWQHIVTSRPVPTVTVDHPGAAVLFDDTIELREGVDPLPDPALMDREWVGVGTRCRGDKVPSHAAVGSICYEIPAENPTADVLLIGNSHMEQFARPIFDLAEKESWSVTSLIGPFCPFGKPLFSSWDNDFDCTNKFQGAMAYVDEQSPDVVIINGSYVNGDYDEIVLDGVIDAVREWTSRGIDVVVIRDNPRFDHNPTTCALEHGPEDPRCTVDVSPILPADSPFIEYSTMEGVYSVDLTNMFCPNGSCPPIIGNMYVWIDSHHTTETYMATTAPELEQQLRDANFPLLSD